MSIRIVILILIALLGFNLLLIAIYLTSMANLRKFIIASLMSVNKMANDQNIVISQQISFNKACLQYCLVALQAYVIAIKRKAVQKENFEEAGRCKDIIEAMNQLIHYDEENSETEK